MEQNIFVVSEPTKAEILYESKISPHRTLEV